MRLTRSHPASRLVRVVASIAAAALALTACGGSPSAAPASTSTSTSGSAASSSPAAGGLSISDTWVKATEGAADPTMTAAFGVLTNTTDKPVTIVSATTSASSHAELHEMAMDNGAMVMRPISGGIPVPAKGSTTLRPGGLHVMIMDVAQPIRAGDDVTVTLTADDGSILEFTALAKDFAGANESYSPSAGEMPGMSGSETTGMAGMSDLPTTPVSPSTDG